MNGQPNHRTSFTSKEIAFIRAAVADKRGRDTRGQRMLRDKLRDMGFYISDFGKFGIDGFSVENLDELISAGRVTISGSIASSD